MKTDGQAPDVDAAIARMRGEHPTRNAEIYAARQRAEKHADIARRFGITPSRVYQILKAEAAKRKEAAPA